MSRTDVVRMVKHLRAIGRETNEVKSVCNGLTDGRVGIMIFNKITEEIFVWYGSLTHDVYRTMSYVVRTER